jgi:hypothetical protein
MVIVGLMVVGRGTSRPGPVSRPPNAAAAPIAEAPDVSPRLDAAERRINAPAPAQQNATEDRELEIEQEYGTLRAKYEQEADELGMIGPERAEEREHFIDFRKKKDQIASRRRQLEARLKELQDADKH